MVTGISLEVFKNFAISFECAATFCKVSSPYKCWLPVMNQTDKPPSLKGKLLFFIKKFYKSSTLNFLIVPLQELGVLTVITVLPMLSFKMFFYQCIFQSQCICAYPFCYECHLCNFFQHSTVVHSFRCIFSPCKWRMIAYQNHFNIFIIQIFFF